MPSELSYYLQQLLINIKATATSPYIISWLTLFASISLAIFAYLSWKTAKLSSEIQATLLTHQNALQEKQHNLSLLKEMLKNSEDFRQLILRIRRTVESEIYVRGCEHVDYISFRSSVSNDYHIITRLGVLFGEDIRKKAKLLLEKYLDAFPDDMIRHYGLIKNGMINPNPIRKLSDQTKNKLLDSHRESINKLLKAGEAFSILLNILDDNISEISTKLNPGINNHEPWRKSGIFQYNITNKKDL